MKVKTKDAEAWALGTRELAKIFGITHGAVSQWGEFLPHARAFELLYLRPDWFFKNGNLKPPPGKENVA